MKKGTWISLTMGALIVTALALPAPAAAQDFVYVEPTFRNSEIYLDPYYQSTVVAYQMGDTIRIDVLLYNWWSFYEFNITEVSIRFDWGKTFYSEEATWLEPYLLGPEEWALIPIEVQLPDHLEVPGINETTHFYEVRAIAYWYEEEVVVGNWMGWDLAVYSPIQAEAMTLYNQLAQRLGLSPLAMFSRSTPPPTFTTAEATVLAQRATNLATEGLNEYRDGNSTEARNTFVLALDLYDRALAAEAEQGKALEDATIQQADALSEQANAQAEQADAMSAQADALKEQADAFESQAQALNEQALAMDEQAQAFDALAQALREQSSVYTILAWGLTIGTILIGIGVVIFAVRSTRRPSAEVKPSSAQGGEKKVE